MKPLCSGYGPFHSPNNEANPRPYVTVTIDRIRELARYPQQVRKDQAQWVIFSPLLSRNHAEQREKGTFYALWADIDETPLTFDEISSRVIETLRPATPIIYTTRSATEENQKCRLIVELSEPVAGELFPIMQKILNDKLEASSVTPDRATERAGQVCYLPNRGEFYRYNVPDPSRPFNPAQWNQEIQKEQQRLAVAEIELRKRQERSRLKAQQRMQAGCESPIDAFNQEYPIELLFDQYGYIRKGSRYLSPNSRSKNAGVTITADGQKWLSTHGSDAAIGMATGNGTLGDAFDLFAFYEYGGDRNAALKAVGDMFKTEAGISLTKHNQIEYMQQKSEAETVNLFSSNPPQNAQNTTSKPRFKLTLVSELLKQPPPLKWLIKGYLLPECNAQLFGDPAAGKSIVAIDWSTHIAIGKDWHGHSVKQGGVIYLAGEGHHGIRRRLAAWAMHNNAEAELAAAPLCVSEKGAALDKETELAEVIAAIDEFALVHGNPVLIVVDTLHRNMGGNENTSEDMATYYRSVDALKLRYGATVLTCHHSGHGDKNRSRGSSSIQGALDAEFSVTKKGEDRFIIGCTKMKDAPKPKPTTWEIKVIELPWSDSDGDPETSVVSVPTDNAPPAGKKMTLAVEHAIKTFFEAATISGSVVSAHLDDWRHFYYESHHGDKDSAKRQAFNRARTGLLRDGVLTVKNDIYTLNSVTNAYAGLAELVRGNMLTK